MHNCSIKSEETFFAGHTISHNSIFYTTTEYVSNSNLKKDAGEKMGNNCGLLGDRDRDCGIDTSLLFFFLLLVVIFCNCSVR